MLEELRISQLGVIEDAVLKLGPGLTVLTGETGAGKTMVVTALGLLLGGKADPGAVRVGAGAALVEGRIRIAAHSAPAARARDAGAELEDGVLLVARSVAGTNGSGTNGSGTSGSSTKGSGSTGSGGRSRAHLGGRSVPAGVLAELADGLVAVHGQSDQHRLLRPARQRDALDRFAGAAVAGPLGEFAAGWARLRELEGRLSDLVTRRQERAQEAELLRFGLERIEAVLPVAGEDVALREEAGRLGNADDLRQAATAAQSALLGDEEAVEPLSSAAGLLDAARRALQNARDHDPALAELADRVTETAYLVLDLGSDLGSYAAGLDADPHRLAAVQDRRAVLSGLTRTYGPALDDVLAWSERAVTRLLELEGSDDEIEVLREERTTLRRRLGRLAAQLSTARTEAATRLGTAVSAEVRALAMPRAVVSVAVSQQVEEGGLEVGDRRLAAGPGGVDEVEVLLAASPDAPARPLGRGASGGELSRLMLALEVVLAGIDPVPTFVFDEVDAGVGGKAAVEIGRRLATLARNAQVLVVTHLPQVAAFADHHLVVVKDEGGSVSRSGVVALDEDGRVGELSRMLAGLEGSATARAHAEELLATARTP